MPKTTLGVQLTSRELLALRLKSGWKGTVVDGITRVERTPSDEGSLPPLPPVLPDADVTVTALAADQVFQRQVELPFTDRRRVERAAPLEAEESLPLPLEGLVCDVQVVAKTSHAATALVAAAPLGRVSELIEEVRTLGAEPQLIDVEALALATVGRRCLPPEETALLIDASPGLCQGVIVERGTPVAFRAFSALPGDPDLLNEVTLYLSSHESEDLPLDAVYFSGPEALSVDLESWGTALDRPVSQLPFPRRGLHASQELTASWPLWAVPLGLGLRGLTPRAASQINLLRGPFGSARDESGGRTLLAVGGACGAVLLALWGASMWAEASFKQTQYDTLRASVRKTFQETLPDVHNIVREVDQLKVKVAELEERDRSLADVLDRQTSPLRVLKELSAKLPRDTEVEFRDLVLDPNRLTIEGTTNSYQASEKIKTDITGADPRFTSVKSEARDGVKPGEVIFTLNVDLGEKR